MEGVAAFVSLGLLTGAGGAGNALAALRGGRCRALAALDLLRALAAFPLAFVGAARPLPRHPRLCQLMAFAQALALAGHGALACATALDRLLLALAASHRRPCAAAPWLALGLAAAVAALSTAWPDGPPPLGLRCTLPRVLAPSPVLAVATLAAFLATNLLYARLFLVLRSRRRMRPVLHPPAISHNWNFGQPLVRERWLAESVATPPISVVGGGRPTNYHLALWRSKKHRESETLTRVCFGVHVIVSVTWLPYVVVLVLLVCGQEGVPEWAEVSVTWLTYIQATVTPVAFSTLPGPTKRRGRNGKRCSPTFSSSST